MWSVADGHCLPCTPCMHGVAGLQHRAIDKRVVRRAVDEYGAVVYR